MKPVNLGKFFSHKEIPHAVLYPKQPSDIKTSHQLSVQYQCFFNFLSSSQCLNVPLIPPLPPPQACNSFSRDSTSTTPPPTRYFSLAQICL